MSSLLSELAKLVSKGMGEKLDKEIMQEVQMNEKLTAEQRVINIVLAEIEGTPSFEFVEIEDENGKSISVGEWIKNGEYWNIRIPLTAHTEPENEKLTAEQRVLDEIMEKAILPLPICNHQQVVDIIEEILTATEPEDECPKCGQSECLQHGYYTNIEPEVEKDADTLYKEIIHDMPKAGAKTFLEK